MYLDTDKIKAAVAQEITRQVTDQGGSSADVEFLSTPHQGKVSTGTISVSAAKQGAQYCGDFYFEELNERKVLPLQR